MAAHQPTLSHLITSLTALYLPTPTSTFLQPILTPPTSNPTRTPPLAVLTATAKHRLLSASITSSPSSPSILIPSTPAFPGNISDVRVKERVLAEDVFVQVVDIQDLGRSRWEQIEGLEAERKGETMKGREVIRVIPVEEEMGVAGTQVLPSQNYNHNQNQGNGNGNGSGNQTGDKASRGPFKLLLQDWKGIMIWGFEVRKVEKVGLPPVMGIGCKLLLRRGTKVARGMVLLEPGNVVVFGGKIDSEDKAWRAGREGRLRREVEERGDGDGDGE